MPIKRQWKALGLVLTYQEKILIAVLNLIIIITLITWGSIYYFKNTKIAPAFGGEYKEAIFGELNSINPLLAKTDADRDLVNLIFSGLMKYGKDGKLIPDLAESYEILDDGKTYIFHLRNSFWHDGEKISADDVVFTIQAAQNPDYKSPERLNWLGVKVEKINDLTAKFNLEKASVSFLENTTMGILPKHISQDKPTLNLRPIGGGPYKYKNSVMNTDGSFQSYSLEANSNYHNPPMIKYVTFLFFKTQDEAMGAFQANQVQGVNFISASNKKPILENFIKRLNSPTYVAIFLNQTKNKNLTNKNVRLALTVAINKNEIIEKAMFNEASVVNSPFFPFQTGYTQNLPAPILPASPAKRGEEKEKMTNLPAGLEINLLTFDLPELVKTAEIIKESWEKIGIKVNLDIQNDAGKFKQDFLKPRNYQALLVGVSLHLNPDPFVFWHSSQKRDPGLNFSLYDNQNADKLILEARQTMDENERSQKYIEFQKILNNDAPAIFLYSPTYLYLLSGEIKGFDLKNITSPSKRFIQIEEWYLKTKRVFK